MKKKIIAVLLLIILTISTTACSNIKKPQRYQAQFLELFDTVTTIIGYAPKEEEFSKFSQSVYDDLKEYHQLFDIYHNYEGVNNIKTINDNAGIAPVKVDPKIIEMLEFSKEAYELSNGRINIAFGAVLSVWHDYREEGTNDPEAAKLPPMELLKEKAQHIDINKMIIDEKASTVYLEDSQMRLDVGAIAKGYATERVVAQAVADGYYNALISVGGNVRALGYKELSITDGSYAEQAASTQTGTTGQSDNNQATDNSKNEKLAALVPWSVGIQNPDLESEEQYLDILNIENLSLVSSGDYERYYTVDGKRYCHIIDPSTLMPATYFREVSIVTEDSGLADALSTTLFNMPYEEGLQLIEDLPDTEALWVFTDGTMKFSSGFAAFLKEDSTTQ